MAKRSKTKKIDQLNETGRRNKKSDRRVGDEPVSEDRRKVQRRRQIDPTTCERDYNDLEIEFMQALDEYKRASGRMFPTCSEILEVIQKLGYQKTDQPAQVCCKCTGELSTTGEEYQHDELDELELLN